MNKYQKAIKSVVKVFDATLIPNGVKVPNNYTCRRKCIKEVLKERNVVSTKDIVVVKNKLIKLLATFPRC